MYFNLTLYIKFMDYKTQQEEFWSGKFGDKYIERNLSKEKLAARLSLFSKIFRKTSKPISLIEFGANIGLNLKAIKLLFPDIKLGAIEINKNASEKLSDFIGQDNVYNGSVLDFEPVVKYEVSLIKGVLIHINPEMLPLVYERLYQTSTKYILISEYYNPTPVSINYRGHEDKLFKRDFAGEMLDKFNDLRLVDYGFVYKRDNSFPLDDNNWFLLEKI